MGNMGAVPGRFCDIIDPGGLCRPDDDNPEVVAVHIEHYPRDWAPLFSTGGGIKSLPPPGSDREYELGGH